jgi:hypothetical protein
MEIMRNQFPGKEETRGRKEHQKEKFTVKRRVSEV